MSIQCKNDVLVAKLIILGFFFFTKSFKCPPKLKSNTFQSGQLSQSCLLVYCLDVSTSGSFFPTFFAQERTLDTFTFWKFWLIELSTSETCDFWVTFVAVLCSMSSSKIVHSTHLQVLLSCTFYQVCDCAALNLKLILLLWL